MGRTTAEADTVRMPAVIPVLNPPAHLASMCRALLDDEHTRPEDLLALLEAMNGAIEHWQRDLEFEVLAVPHRR